MRAWDKSQPPVTVSGIYNDHAKLVDDMVILDDPDVAGIYYSLNPCTEEFYAEYAHTESFGMGMAAKAEHIQHRSCLLIDIDTIKRVTREIHKLPRLPPKPLAEDQEQRKRQVQALRARYGYVATGEERNASKEVMLQVRDRLREFGIDPATATSGNGWYCLVKLPDIPNDAESKQLVTRMQFFLKQNFGCPQGDPIKT